MGISSILRLAQIARDLKAQGKPVVDLSAGQPGLHGDVRVRAGTGCRGGAG